MRAVVVASMFTIAVGPIESRGAYPNQFPAYPHLGMYSNLFGLLCGKNKIATSPSEIPRIGCFAVKVGSSLSGKIEGRTIRIYVAMDGSESFSVDGKRLDRMLGGVTSDPFVRNSSSGFAFCRKKAPSDCPTTINTLERTPGEFAAFSVAREFAPNSYVTTEENYEYERSTRGSYTGGP